MHRTRYLIDTDVIINYLKGMGKSKDFLMKIIDGEAIGFFSVITEAELLSGARDAKDENSIYAILDLMEAAEVDRDIAVSAGKLRRKYYGAHTGRMMAGIEKVLMKSVEFLSGKIMFERCVT